VSEIDELVEKLSGSVAGAVKKALDEAKTPSLEERLMEHIDGRFNEFFDALTGDGEAGEGEAVSGGDITKALGVTPDALAGALKELNDSNTALAGAVEKMLDRLETVEKAVTGRKSIAGQDGTENTEVKKAAPGAGIEAVLKQLGRGVRNGQNGSVTLV